MDPYQQNQNSNYMQMLPSGGQNFVPAYGAGAPYEQPQNNISSDNPLLIEKQQEINNIDASLSKDYLWYRLWLWFDFFLNIAWFVYVLVAGLSGANAQVIISFLLTIFILITISYGLSAFNSKLPQRQKRFIQFLKLLIILYIIDIPVLIFGGSVTMIIGRVAGTIISIIVLYTARDLEIVLGRRMELMKQADNMVYA